MIGRKMFLSLNFKNSYREKNSVLAVLKIDLSRSLSKNLF